MTRTSASTLLLAGTITWCLAILATPVGGFTPAYSLFGIICHQDPARSWRLMGEPLPVCIRCASIYFGFLISLFLRLQPSTRWLHWSVALTLLEFAVAHLVLDSAIIRSLTGLALGLSVAPFVRQGIEEMWETLRGSV